jgi:uncharacterized membrane protein
MRATHNMPIVRLTHIIFGSCLPLLLSALLLFASGVLIWHGTYGIAVVISALQVFVIYKSVSRLLIDVRYYRLRHEIARARQEFIENVERTLKDLDGPERSRYFADTLSEIMRGPRA